MISKSFWQSICIVLGMALFGVAVYYFVFIQPTSATPPPVMGKIEDFKLINTDGQEFKKSELDGKVWVADLVFTSCKMTCPMMTKRMKNVYRSYELEDNVRFVSVSVDPENDTPEVLKKYTQDNEINGQKWYFLTGEMDQIQKLARESFKLIAADDPNLHSDRFVLIDHMSQVRGYYDAKDKASLRKLFQERALVLNESKTHDS